MKLFTTIAVSFFAVSVFALEGSFESSCLTLGEPDSQFDVVDRFETDGATFASPYTRYETADGTCTTPVLTGSLQGPVVIGESAGDLTPMDQKLERFMVTLHTQAEVDRFNEAKLCKHDGWALETTIDVFDLDCEGVISIKRGDSIFTVFKTDGDNLFLGMGAEGSDGSTVEQRHSAVSDIALTRK